MKYRNCVYSKGACSAGRSAWNDKALVAIPAGALQQDGFIRQAEALL